MRVVITGAARGIGYATATLLKDKGAEVVIGDIDEAAAVQAGERLGVEAGRVDVTDRESFAAFLDRAGAVDVLVNNAGIMPIGPVEDETDEDARRCMDVNVMGVMIGTKLAIARDIRHIINIASLAGVIPMPGLALYNASKAAVAMFTEATRLEVAPRGFHVSAVLPTFTNTELLAGASGPRGERTREPGEIAAAVASLIVRPRPQVMVPGRFAVNVRLMGLIPERVKRAMYRWYRLDRIFLDFDHDARKAYDARIRERL